MTLSVFALPGNERAAQSLAMSLGADLGKTEIRNFPDGETYVRIDSPVRDSDVILYCTLDHPDGRFLPLRFLADTARSLGARSVGLVSPYLAYMRQDRRFRPGEALTSESFARCLSDSVDWIITVDPHLHRRQSLSEIYSIPAVATHAASEIAAWVRRNVERPVLIGPDSESRQWVAEVAAAADAPYDVLEKVRSGDRQVEVSLPALAGHAGRTPVLLDDIISTARTMIAATRQLHRAGFAQPICVGVHAIFSETAFADLQVAGARKIVTCDTISHPSNGIDLTELLATAVRAMVVR